jgi:transketolase
VQCGRATRGVELPVYSCNAVVPLPCGDLPLDRYEWVFVLEDHTTFGGLASLVRHAHFKASTVSFGWPPEWFGGSAADEDLLRSAGLEPRQVAVEILRRLRKG